MNFDKVKIKEVIKADMDVYIKVIPSGWTRKTILLDAMDQSFALNGPPIWEAAAQIKTSGETWDETLKNETVSILLECSRELFDIHYPLFWSKVKPIIEPPLLLTMEVMPTLLR